MERLISADALDREMYRKSFEVDDGRNVWNSGLWIRYKIFEEAIRDAPTIDAEPVRHGRWIYHEDDMEFYDTYICSECDFELTVDPESRCDMGMVIEDALYCPHCGSRNVVETCSVHVPEWIKKNDKTD